MRTRQRGLSGWLPIAAWLLTACQQPETTRFEPPRVLEESPYAETGDFDAIQRHGKLRLLMVRRPDAVTHLPRSGSPVNTQLRAATRFARSVGLEPVVVLVDRFDQLMPALKEGRGDLIVANLPITERHREEIDFTAALDRNRQVLVAREDDPIEAPADLDGRAITVDFESRFWRAGRRLQDEHAGLEVHSLPALSTSRKLDHLASGDIDLTIVDGNSLEVALGYRDSIREVFPVSAETGIA
ncbi:MAG: transporter substrate-binding domain-containing protein, partial [Halofilum sp. (in: g-proteobacteria)]